MEYSTLTEKQTSSLHYCCLKVGNKFQVEGASKEGELQVYQRKKYSIKFSSFLLILRLCKKRFSCFKIVIPCTYLMFCAIWYHLHNLKNVKNTHGGVLLLVKLKVTLLYWYVSRFLNYISNGTKLRKLSLIVSNCLQ